MERKKYSLEQAEAEWQSLDQNKRQRQLALIEDYIYEDAEAKA